ncbi:hypothetical protein FSARC_1215 [Fusarium sarcochroum]|uniref:Uncharacterized protein n=1 Tax=Fusarium sarcochroum TaxID=1208366 RepID=A0A8H4XF55_9HYPO|nr:hypothetical protein FSARC_1215 [Fusarium sarcochroum]
MHYQASAKARARSVSNPQASWSRNRSQPVTPLSPGFPTLGPSASGHRQGLPAWDRTFDAVYHGTARKASFEDVLSSFFEAHGRKRPCSGYFRLPDSVRLRICQYLLPNSDKPLRLNKHSFNRDVWRAQDFESPTSTLKPLSNYFQVSFAFRADVLIAFLQHQRLHAVFSPFIGPRISPLATIWLNLYGMYAVNIVIELDMTHLGCGSEPGAADLLPNVEHIENLIQKFVAAQLKRSESCPMQSLVLLCRRFHGKRPPKPIPVRYNGTINYSRPASRSAKTPEPYSPTETLQRRQGFESDAERLTSPTFPADLRSPTLPTISLVQEYCPDSYLMFCNNILHLKGRINSIRMCGFSEDYTARFVGTLFSNEHKSLAYRVAPSTIWPKLNGQKSYVDMGDGNLSLDEHEVSASNDIPSVLRMWEGCVQLPPPIIDVHGNLLLPAIVGDLQQLRNAVARSGTSLSERTCEELRKETTKGSENSEKKRLLWFKNNNGKGKLKKKKRVLSRDAATTY